jgi:potassium-transporting ATPase KdpC subunit
MTAETDHEEPPVDGAQPRRRQLAREARRTLSITAILAVLAGGVFPALVLALGQLLFPAQANGSLVRDGQGQVIGSELVGQTFSGSEYFHGRPSAAGADGYDALTSSGLNLAPTNPKLAETIDERARAYRAENGVPADVPLPADAVTTSASGLDPDISPANALLQVPRIARARGLGEAAVRDLVERTVEGPLLGFIGEPRVNVLRLNRALDKLQP